MLKLKKPASSPFHDTSMALILTFLGAAACPSTALAFEKALLPAPIQDVDYLPATKAEVALGQLLFWDKILSGNQSISCGTCHHPRFGTGDGLSLGFGDGGIGLGAERVADPENYPEQRVPRNSPALYNTGALEYTALFADGRVETDRLRPAGIRSPLEEEMMSGFASVLSAQTMFPVLSPDEMAGHYEENDISTLVRQGRLTGPSGAWAKIAARVANIPEYQSLFEAAYPDIKAGRALDFTDISNAVAAFMTVEFRSDSAPFDAYLRGTAELAPASQRGMEFFYGQGGCSNCHAGPFMTDHDFHAMGTPQLGPGKGERFERHQRDIGRMRVTNRPEDMFAFRTASLRNVTLTAPYGHAGGHLDLGDFLKFHADPKQQLRRYEPQGLLPPLQDSKDDWGSLKNGQDFPAIAAAVTAPAVTLSAQTLDELLAFLGSLEDPIAKAGGAMGIPAHVPSGLAIDR
tara:strand:- start:399 stop:1781 length:1383 start_codon:yes stop_codon:yes gene_type:complete